MPLTIRLSASRLALFAAIAILPVSAQVLAEPGVATLQAVAVTQDAVSAPVLAESDDVIAAADDTNTPEIAATDLECVAKVVLHEAGNQPRVGQLAVAQVVVNRAESGRFPDKVCDVINQPGQFFALSTYHPSRNTPMWRAAIDAARAVLSGQANDVTKGAMFFHTASSNPDRFFRTRQRVVQLHDHIFYR